MDRKISRKGIDLESGDLGLRLVTLIKGQDGHLRDVSDGLLVGRDLTVQFGDHVVEGGTLLNLKSIFEESLLNLLS